MTCTSLLENNKCVLLNLGINIVFSLMLALPNVVAAADLLFTTQDNQFFRLTTNGAVTKLGTTLATTSKGLAYSGSTLYSLDRSSGGEPLLLRALNPATGATLTSPSIKTVTLGGFTLTDGFGLASHPQTGQLFAIFGASGVSGVLLVTINPANGVASLVGTINITFVGLAFDGSGTLYGVSASNAPSGLKNRLYILNQTNASRTFVLNLANSSSSGVPHAIGFHRQTNRLYHFSGTSAGTFEEINLSTLGRTVRPLSLPAGVTFTNGMALTARRHQLQVSVTGTASGTVTSSPGGINCGGDCLESFDDDQAVTLSQNPAVGAQFSGWSGACGGTGSCVVTMSTVRSVTATFAPVPVSQFALQVNPGGAGSGTVSSSPGGITCGSDCSQTYNNGTNVTLTAVANSGSTFAGWSGGGCSGTGACNVTMTTNITVTATFNPIPRLLTVSKLGSGSGTVSSSPGGITCGSDCSQTYNNGTNVTLTAVANSGSTFAGWSGGGCSGMGACNVTMTANLTVRATFNALPLALTVTTAGTGGGVVTSSPSGINCGGDCTENFSSGTMVTLTAAPDSASIFVGWNGACSGTGNCQISMTAPRMVGATFSLIIAPPTDRFLMTAQTTTASPPTSNTILHLLTAEGGVTEIGRLDHRNNGLAFIGSTLFSLDRFSSNLRTINPKTGDTLSLIPLNLVGVNLTGGTGLATEPGTNTLWGLLIAFGEDNDFRRLVTINPTTGVVTQIAKVSGRLSDMAFDATGTLYAINGNRPSTQGEIIRPARIYELNKVTGALTEFLNVSDGAVQGQPNARLGETIGFGPLGGQLFHLSGQNNNFQNITTNILFETIDLMTKVRTSIPILGPEFHVTTALTACTTACPGLSGGSDVNGDGRADLVWRNMNNGATHVWQMTPGATRGPVTFPGGLPTNWVIQGVADVNGDGRADVISRNMNNGGTHVWQMTPGATRGPVTFPGGLPTNWVIQGVADVNGDGRADIIWRNMNNGATHVWQMTAGATRGPVTFPGGLPTNWQIQAVADVNGDGRADIIWRNMNNGATHVWQMTAGATRGPVTFPGGLPTNWVIQGVADVNGDGRADIIWRNMNNGATHVWQMTAMALRGPLTFPGGLPTNWQIQNVADVNGDGRADLVWRNINNGATHVWQMTAGGTRGPVTFPGGLPSNWELQP